MIEISDKIFTPRVARLLLADGYRTLEDLETISKPEVLLWVPNFGRRALHETMEVMRKHGMKLASRRND